MVSIAFRSRKNRDHIARAMRKAGCKVRRASQQIGASRTYFIDVRNTIAFGRYMASRGVFR